MKLVHVYPPQKSIRIVPGFPAIICSSVLKAYHQGGSTPYAMNLAISLLGTCVLCGSGELDDARDEERLVRFLAVQIETGLSSGMTNFGG